MTTGWTRRITRMTAFTGSMLLSMSVLATEQIWSFKVLLDGKPIGHHQFTVGTRDNTRVVTSVARFVVKLLFVEVYSYTHDAREQWQGNCLTGIQSATRDNGKRYHVQGDSREGVLQVVTNAGEQSLTGCVMGFAYWNPAILKERQLMNAQTGEYVPVEVRDLGRSTATLTNRSVPAHRYALVGPDFHIDVWYTDDGHWVQLESQTDSGRVLQYRLEDPDKANAAAKVLDSERGQSASLPVTGVAPVTAGG